MQTGRLEAFSDGVLAIIIIIMVLALEVPSSPDIAALQAVWPTLLSYVLSDLYLGIYWNNHHHLFQAAERVNGRILWANLHLLLWLSLIPFVTGWMGKNQFETIPVALYGGVLLASAIAYFVLVRVLVDYQGYHSILLRSLGKGSKEKLSIIAYAIAIPLAF